MIVEGELSLDFEFTARTTPEFWQFSELLTMTNLNGIKEYKERTGIDIEFDGLTVIRRNGVYLGKIRYRRVNND